MANTREKIKHPSRIKVPAGPVTVRKVALGFADLADALQRDALDSV